MFIASKYEDVIPLHLETVVKKIAHSKLPKEAILAKEQDILQALGFKISAPTPFEFVGCLFETLTELKEHRDKALLLTISTYLCKMALHHIELYTKSASLIAQASVFVANKIYEQMVNLSA